MYRSYSFRGFGEPCAIDLRATGTEPNAVLTSLCCTNPMCLLHLYRYSTQYDDWSAVWCSLARWQWIVKRSLGDIGAVEFNFLCSKCDQQAVQYANKYCCSFLTHLIPKSYAVWQWSVISPTTGISLVQTGPEKFSAPCHAIPNTQIWTISQEGAFLYLQPILAGSLLMDLKYGVS